MSVKINFDSAGIPETPTCVLAKRSGDLIGTINNIEQLRFSDNLNSSSDLSFIIHKRINGTKCNYWDEIRDERLIYIPEWDKWFEIHVEIEENDSCTKSIIATSLCETELSKIFLYEVEINTPDDIARSDYVSTVLYNQNNAEGSLLNRLLKDKALHYKVIHVDESIQNIQRTFSFDNISLYDAFQKISEEINCLFIFGTWSETYNSFRTISVYDLESSCIDCGYRGEFSDICPKCKSENISDGYGEDTTIFVSTENLSEEISYSTDKDSVKNCFRLKSGDDDMDAAIINCNPSGSLYLQYIDNRTKEDMSEELVSKLNSYDEENDHYTNYHEFIIPKEILDKYNQLIEKYKIYNEDLQEIVSPIIGYKNLIKSYYDVIDFSGYLRNSLMPSPEMSETSAAKQVLQLTSTNLSPISLENTKYISLATADSAILSYAKVFIDTSKYKIKVNTSSLNNSIWTGNFVVTSYSDEEDTAVSNTVNIAFNDNYENFTKQKIDKVLAKDDDEDLSIVGLFEKDDTLFKNELKKYGLSYLQIFYNSCQSCLDILIEQGIADNSKQTDLYNSLYRPYFNKLNYISEEMKLREDEVNIIIGVYDTNGDIISDGVKSIIDDYKNDTLGKLDFQKYLGDHWTEFCSFRNEDLWQNDNYISDGLDNSQLFKRAEEFLDAAKKDLIKSATLQHLISSTLKNLLVIDSFKPIIKFFSVGNWIRLSVDEKIYKLRIINYEIDYDDLKTLSITFSDVIQEIGTISDIKSILDQSRSLSSSYSSFKHQAEKMEISNNTVDDWVKKGLDATTVKIVNNADNQDIVYDEHGMLFRKFDPITNTYYPTQLKIINSTLAVTTDDWETSNVGVGEFIYFDPKDKKYKTGYGVIADTIVGNIILGEDIGIYNDTGSLTFNTEGLKITNGKNSFTVNPNSEKMLSLKYGESEIFYVGNDSAKISGFNIDGTALYNGPETVLSKNKGIYIGNDGININSDNANFLVNPSGEKLLSISNKTDEVLCVDKNGKLTIKGNGAGLDISSNNTITGMSSRISQNESSITAEVTRAINQEVELAAAISVQANQIALKVTAGDVESLIEQNADSIRLKASKISWESLYSSMSENGLLKCTSAELSGNFKCGISNYIYIDDGKIKGGHKDPIIGERQYGYIDYSASVWNVTEEKRYHGIHAVSECIVLRAKDLATVSSTDENATALLGGNGTLLAIVDFKQEADGSFSWAVQPVRFENGIMVTQL